MPWCPLCKDEYVKGMKSCAECGSPLVDELTPESDETLPKPGMPEFLPDAKETLLFTSENEVEFALITEALANEKILFRTDEEAVWSYFHILSGHSFNGQNVYVLSDDYVKAKEIYDYFQVLKNQEQGDTADS